MHVPQPMRACRGGLEHSDWTTLRAEKMIDADVAAQKRKYSPSELQCQADKSRSRMRVNLSLTFSSFQTLKKRLEMKSNVEVVCFLLDRQVPNTDS